MNETMLWFDPAKRHGFIRTEHGVDNAEPGAAQVTVIPIVATRRARPRKH